MLKYGNIALIEIRAWWYSLSPDLQDKVAEAYETAVAEQNCNIDFEEYLIDNKESILLPDIE